MGGPDRKAIEDIEVPLFLEAVYRISGYDFREYAPASLKRRILNCVRAEGLASISGLQEKALHDPEGLERFLVAVAVNVTGMFRDPGFYLALRRKAVPLLRDLPLVRVWDAGCSTGEEVYSLAILLREEGLADRARLYATDMIDAFLRKARQGVFPRPAMKEYAACYEGAGGRGRLADYYTADGDRVAFLPSLQQGVVWAQHNLVTDGSFNEFHLILCRNVMIYFTQALQGRVHRLLHDSLAMGGVLALGGKESLRLTPLDKCYEVLDEREKLYRKVR